MSRILLIVFGIAFLSGFSQEKFRSFEDYIIGRGTDSHGKETVRITVPGRPPAHHREPVAEPTRSAVLLDLVPAFSWSFGCSATAAAMAAGYYDNNGYPDMYTGPTNWGFMPMNNSIWGTAVINDEPRDLCPLSATRNGLDGRTTRGHVDDYWISYGNTDPDPWITNAWTEHDHGDCTGDFMGTNQSATGNSDGSTTFVYYADGAPFSGTEFGDGCYGLKVFYESRGYNVVSYYSQYIDELPNVPYGFTFEQYKQEIDNGRPVLIHVAGHTMLGYGYDDDGNTVYLHDTWDYSSHTMAWGGSYAGMAHYSVSVVQLEPPSVDIMANFTADKRRQLVNSTVNLVDWTYGNPVSWTWSITPETYIFSGGTSSASQNPLVQFTAGGFYTVTLTVTDGIHGDVETKSGFIEAVDCNIFQMPLEEDFSEQTLPICWLNIDHIGNGQVWEFNNLWTGWPIYTATAANGFAILNSDKYGGGYTQNADLVTPALDLSLFTAVNLYFQHYFKPWSGSSGTLSYSINNGNTWTVIQSWTSSPNPETFDQDVTALVAGHSSVRFKWNYIGDWGYLWVVDDVHITGTAPGLWTGRVSSAWNDAGNWSGGIVPQSTTNVVIPSIAPNWPAHTGNLTVGTHCGNITLKGSSRLTVNGGR